MELPAGQIWVGAVEDRVCIRVQGRATHLHGPPLRDFAKEMIRRGHRNFELDLGGCSYMDSTFLGILVGVSMRLSSVGANPVTIYRINQKNIELFRTLGVDRFFRISSPTAAALEPPASSLQQLENSKISEIEWAGTILEAHELLVDVDERNEPRFKDLLDYLKEDLADKQRSFFASSKEPAARYKQ